ncbi:MAG: flavin reductase family protein [Pigmentiphaga sp.]|uniref:flavin reductase family protein n=1 Tax=Pigmentiphaga sp. TaxID=1977564 RepID=UPI0029BAB7CD|nr:flavin reductase family protein [Pigmentiphaga sp.]MDX3904694.1 flavin reductase family protein [Pigmentiphaga sp.]
MQTESSAIKPIDQLEFRSALGQFPTGVAVVTAEAPDGSRIGMTVTSFNSVSLDPPLVLFSIGRNSYSLPGLEAASHYSVNVLSEGQQDVSARFAKARSDKWTGVPIRNHDDLPFTLDDCLATFQCAQFAQYDGGDHVIFVGRVLRVEQRGAGRPLVFFGGRYAALAEVA